MRWPPGAPPVPPPAPALPWPPGAPPVPPPPPAPHVDASVDQWDIMPSHIPFGPEEPGSRKIFVLGGASEGTPAELCSVELFDATTETFTQVPTMPVNLGALSSAACAQG